MSILIGLKFNQIGWIIAEFLDADNRTRITRMGSADDAHEIVMLEENARHMPVR